VENTPQLDLAAGPQPDAMGSVALQIWDLMDGDLDWSALPMFCELFGVTDPELLIRSLAMIREAAKK
jgi:hypothetical protein